MFAYNNKMINFDKLFFNFCNRYVFIFANNFYLKIFVKSLSLYIKIKPPFFLNFSQQLIKI